MNMREEVRDVNDMQLNRFSAQRKAEAMDRVSAGLRSTIFMPFRDYPLAISLEFLKGLRTPVYGAGDTPLDVGPSEGHRD